MKIGNFEINMNNIQLLLIVGLLGVVTWLLIFDKSDGKELRDQSDDRVEQLEQQVKDLQKDRISIIDSLKYYVDKEEEWNEIDSLRKQQIIEAKEETDRYLRKMAKAEKERKDAVKKLEEFKKNPPKINDPIDLINDTKNRVKK